MQRDARQRKDQIPGNAHFLAIDPGQLVARFRILPIGRLTVNQGPSPGKPERA